MKPKNSIKTVDEYLLKGCGRCEFFNTPFCKVNKWRELLIKIREFILRTELKEELKWKQPCYTFEGKNILLLSAFKNFVAISFFKGTLISDPHKLLVSPGENSQSVKQIRFTSLNDFENLKPLLINFINEAIEIQKSGKKLEKKIELEIPVELHRRFSQDLEFKKAFYSLSPGRQRAYIIYFSQPKKSETRIARIEKMFNKILDGKGLMD